MKFSPFKPPPSTIPLPCHLSGYLGTLAHISGLVALTTNHNVAVGPPEELTKPFQ